jgi:hypothetical protein
MSAGITQLIAIGAQDQFIMGKPEISFFSSTFKRHSNFSQSIEKQTIYGAVKNNSMSSVQFERSGDLLGYCYLTLDDTTQALDTQRWDTIIDKVELLIGGAVIDSQDAIFTEKIAIDTFAQNVSKSANGTHPGVSARSYFYPLRFFFCEGPQCALPLVALNYHNVEVRIHWASEASNYNVEMFANYYYLDNSERGAIASRKHDLLNHPGSKEHSVEPYHTGTLLFTPREIYRLFGHDDRRRAHESHEQSEDHHQRTRSVYAAMGEAAFHRCSELLPHEFRDITRFLPVLLLSQHVIAAAYGNSKFFSTRECQDRERQHAHQSPYIRRQLQHPTHRERHGGTFIRQLKIPDYSNYGQKLTDGRKIHQNSVW